MDPSHRADPREILRQAIDVEIKTLEESIRALRLRRNALAPVSSLPTEVITAIFSFLRLPASGTTPLRRKTDHQLAWLSVAHVCRRWCEIALDLPHFWSHIDFTTVSQAGATEILARAKTAPLYLEAWVPMHSWNGARFEAFREVLQDHVSRICHLGLSVEPFSLYRMIEWPMSPAPKLEYLALAREKYRRRGDRTEMGTDTVFIPNHLFGGSAPRLSCLELRNCDISWESPLLRRLKHLEIRKNSPNARPGLSDWLDALDEMSQLKTLELHWASPIAPQGASLPFDVERTVTLPSLTHLSFSASLTSCGLALAHLVLPALTSLCVTARTCRWVSGDVQKIFSYVARHAHGPQDTQPLQSVLIRGELVIAEYKRVDILAWTVPDIDMQTPNQDALRRAISSARVAFSVIRNMDSAYAGLFDAAMTALPLDGLVTLTVERFTSARARPKGTWVGEQYWLRHAPSWPLLRRVRLEQHTARRFFKMLLEDDGSSGLSLLPSLTELVLIRTELSTRKTHRLCDALRKRVEQGVPLKTLDLRTCLATSRTVKLLSEIVVDVLGPEKASDSWMDFPRLRALGSDDSEDEGREYISCDDAWEDGWSDDGEDKADDW